MHIRRSQSEGLLHTGEWLLLLFERLSHAVACRLRELTYLSVHWVTRIQDRAAAVSQSESPTQTPVCLGDFDTCSSAVRAAKNYYSQCNGCYYCANACDTT